MVHKEVESLMAEKSGLDVELAQRLREIEAEEASDTVHASLSGTSLGLFLAVAIGIAVFGAIGAML